MKMRPFFPEAENWPTDGYVEYGQAFESEPIRDVYLRWARQGEMRQLAGEMLNAAEKEVGPFAYQIWGSKEVAPDTNIPSAPVIVAAWYALKVKPID
jgi:hypothetical protein